MTNNDLKATIATTYKNDFRRLYFCAYKVCRNLPDASEVARDIVNDAFVKACSGAYTGANGASLYTFLYGVVGNASIDTIRRHENSRRVRSRLASSPSAVERTESMWQASDVTPRPFTGPERAYLNLERRELVKAALSQHCTSREVAVWQACKLDGMTTTAAADMLGLTQPTTYRAMTSATAKVSAYVAEMTC